MEHPQVVDPAHPLVERVRAICLAFPESSEVEAWGRPSFRVGTKIFVLAGAGMEHPFSIVFKPGPDEAGSYLADARFFAPRYWGARGWLATHIDEPTTDWTELAEIIDTSYRQVALVRQIKALDLAGGRNNSERLV